MLSYYNTIDEINGKCDTAILPIGSIEQHSSHLPTGTDYFIIKKLSENVAQKLDAYLLPPLPISTCYEHTGKQGSVCMRPTVFMEMLKDIILNLRAQGFTKVIIMLGHGGIFAAGPVVRELNSMYDDLQVIKVEGLKNEKIRALIEGDPDNEIHAGERETSLMLYIEEDTVKKDKMKNNDCIPDCPREYLNYNSLLKLSKTGAWGMPSYATKEKGEKLLEYMTEEALKYIEKAFSVTQAESWYK